MRVMARFGLVLDVTDVNGDTTRFFFRRVVNIIVLHPLGLPLQTKHLGDGSGERGLAVIDVTNRPDIDMGLVTFKLSHVSLILYALRLLLTFFAGRARALPTEYDILSE
jgi:hypothetical protein